MFTYPYMFQGGPTIKDYEEFQDFLEERDRKKKEREDRPPKPRNFSVIELFILLCFLSIPVGMLTSWLTLVGIKHWMETMQLYIK